VRSERKQARFAIVLHAARGATSCSIRNPPAQGAVGDIEIIAGLQIDPELWRGAKVPPETHRGVGGDRPAPEYDVDVPPLAIALYEADPPLAGR
jgi:hypothetical protein